MPQKINKPFLKWAGGKTKVVPHILPLINKDRLVEPFVGSGALFLNSDCKSFLLADNNPDLIDLYQVLQLEGKIFIEDAKKLFTPNTNDEAYYYSKRDEFNQLKTKKKSKKNNKRKSLLFIYLNRHCYNGLCRYNKRGIFNVPFGRYDKVYFPETEMEFFYHKSQSAEFICSDFCETMNYVREHSVVYCDPPYIPLSVTSSFTQYSGEVFDMDKQRLLVQKAEELAKKKGIKVIISNHNTDEIKKMYCSATIRELEVLRSISANSVKRKYVSELLAEFV